MKTGSDTESPLSMVERELEGMAYQVFTVEINLASFHDLQRGRPV